MKTKEELITQYASRVYEHQANEPQFDCTMAEFQMSDCLDMLTEYADQQTANLKKALELAIRYVPKDMQTYDIALAALKEVENGK